MRGGSRTRCELYDESTLSTFSLNPLLAVCRSPCREATSSAQGGTRSCLIFVLDDNSMFRACSYVRLCGQSVLRRCKAGVLALAMLSKGK
jgi:hypothetical protein